MQKLCNFGLASIDWVSAADLKSADRTSWGFKPFYLHWVTTKKFDRFRKSFCKQPIKITREKPSSKTNREEKIINHAKIAPTRSLSCFYMNYHAALRWL